MPDVRSDEPIDSVVDDLFGYSYQASEIAKLVGSKESKDHLSVGVSGSWGSGKTSLLNMVKELLEFRGKFKEYKTLRKSISKCDKKRNYSIYRKILIFRKYRLKFAEKKHLLGLQFQLTDVKVIWFEPWFFGSEETVIKAFFYRIAKELVDGDEELSKLFLKLAIVMSSNPDIPELSSLPVVGDALKIINFGRNLITRMSGDDGSIMDFSNIKDKIKARLGESKRIVIIIDDLDRLQTDEALTMLKAIRLLISFSNINIVFSYDENTLTSIINSKMNPFGRDYISKIVKYPTYTPVYTTLEYENFLLDNFLYNKSTLLDDIIRNYFRNIDPATLNENEKRRRVLSLDVFKILTSAELSLRDIKRLFNSFDFGYKSIHANNLNPIHYLVHCVLYYKYFDQYLCIIRNCSEYFDIIEDILVNSDEKRLVVLNNKAAELRRTNNFLFRLLSSISISRSEFEGTTHQEREDPNYYPFGFTNSICFFKNEQFYFKLAITAST